MELSNLEVLRIQHTTLIYVKNRVETEFKFDHFSFMALLHALKFLLPFIVNPSVEQHKRIFEFMEICAKENLVAEDFVYPEFSPKMSQALRILYEKHKYGHTEFFLLKHFFGIHISFFEILYELLILTAPQ